MNPFNHKITRATRHTALMLLVSFLLVSCGGGGTSNTVVSSGNPIAAATPMSLGLEKIGMSYNGLPRTGQTVTITLNSTVTLSDIQWILILQPTGSTASLQMSSDKMFASLIPIVYGEYEIKVNAKVNGQAAETTTNFRIEPEYSYDPAKVVKDPNASIDAVIGVIANQIFVFSTSKTEQELRSILAKYPRLSVVGYDTIEGLLIEFNDADATIQQDIGSLKLEPGVDFVNKRMHEGKDVPRSSIPAYDPVFDRTSAGYSSDNYWHLTKIDALKAWDATQGSDQFLIGIVDKSFAKNHVDIDGKISEDIDSYWNDLANAFPLTANYHGTSVTSAIAANTNNGKGIAGINWNTKLVIGTYGSGSSGVSSRRTIRSVLDKRKNNLEVLLCNNSWTMAGYISEGIGDFNPFNPDGTVSASGLARQNVALDSSRSYRKMALAYSGNGGITSIFLYGVKKEKLFIWAAGNGNNNGGAKNGIYGVDAKFENGAIHLGADGSYSPLDNTIVVAAMENSGILQFTSAYGQTVDIAAPSHYAAATDVTSTGTSSYKIFGGTSAAAPVVTGAASLIYSLYPEFTPKQVKEILISSAVEYVTQRYTDPSNTNTQALARSIPILNLNLAVQEAQKRRSLLSVNPFVNSIHIINNALSVTFSKAINTSTLNASTFTLSGPNGLVSGTVEPNAATFTPSASLADMTTYTVTVTTGVKDLSGNPLASNYTWSFNTSTGSAAPPSVTTYSLTTNITGTGIGTVLSGPSTASPTGINCSVGTCTALYNSGASVTLIATPATGSSFVGWTGGGCSGVGSCSVTMNAGVTVTATFSASTPLPVVTLTATPSSIANGATSTLNWSSTNSTSCTSPGGGTGTTGTFTTPPLTATTTYTVTCTGAGGTASRSVAVIVAEVAPPPPTTGTLNDTGITSAQCYQAGSDILVACNSAEAMALNPAQDGMVGRDANAATNSATDGKSGFSFTAVADGVNPNGCVQDNVTGLMWEVKTADGGLRDWTKTYTNYDSTLSAQKYNGVTLVAPTQAEIDAPTNSIGFKNSVNEQGLCGFSDWRLPTADELHSIVDYSVPYPGPTIDTTWFPNTPSGASAGFGAFWSASSFVDNSGFGGGGAAAAWFVGLGGGVSFMGRDNGAHMRLVRGGQSPTISRYTVSADGQEVTDNQTKLIWRRCAEGMHWDGFTCAGVAARFTHEAALQRAATQAASTGNAWRLPNAKELASIVDRSRSLPAIDPAAFPVTPPGPFWSASPYVGSTNVAWNVAWVVSFYGSGGDFGSTSPRSGNVPVVRLVRAAP